MFDFEFSSDTVVTIQGIEYPWKCIGAAEDPEELRKQMEKEKGFSITITYSQEWSTYDIRYSLRKNPPEFNNSSYCRLDRDGKHDRWKCHTSEQIETILRRERIQEKRINMNKDTARITPKK